MSETFHSIFERHLGDDISGFELYTEINGIGFYLCFYLGQTDFEQLPHLIPNERFEAGHDIHVGELKEKTSIAEEMESLLSLLQDQETLVLFCENEDCIKQALAFIHFPVDEEPEEAAPFTG